MLDAPLMVLPWAEDSVIRLEIQVGVEERVVGDQPERTGMTVPARSALTEKAAIMSWNQHG